MRAHFFTFQLFSQSRDIGYRGIVTNEFQKELVKQDPKILQKNARFNRFADSVKSSLNPRPIIIPLVFHIFHSSSEDYVSREQVLSQIEALNRDFGNKDYKIRHKADTLERFSQRVADIKISFCLARAPKGDTQLDPIHYISNSRSSWSRGEDLKDGQRSGTSPWSPEEVVNIYVAKLDNGIRGYAQMPGGPSTSDGIVIDYRFFGIGGSSVFPYNEGKTLTHLMGNYFGLYPLWGKGEPCSDDGVEDTPIHNAQQINVILINILVPVEGYPVAMSMNFMDNTPDACSYMFTRGQMLRMRASLSPGGPRNSLLSNLSQCGRRPARLADIQEQAEIVDEVYQVEVFPNPARDQVSFILSSSQGGELLLNIITPTGVNIWANRYSLQSGESKRIKLDIEKWSAGIYLIQSQTDKKSNIYRLVIQ